MALSDKQLYVLLTNPPDAFLAAIGGAVYKAATAIQSEPAGTANHANRLADATIGALADPTAATDAMIENRVNGLLSVASFLANYGT
jgi:hypothetical protein